MCLLRRASAISLILSGLSPAAAQAPGSSPTSLAQALSHARVQGCGGHPQPGLAPLDEVPALSGAARRLAQGDALQQALRSAGYRAQQATEIRLSGFADASAIAQAVSQRYCQALTSAAFTEVGVYRQGRDAWIVLAKPFSPPAASQAPQVAQQVLSLVNQARSHARTCGDQHFGPAPALSLDAALSRAAKAHAQDMAEHSFMAHRGSDGSSPAERVSRAGYEWRAVGENVAAGPQSARAVVQGWLDSPEHCANIMSPAFRHMGLGYAVNKQSEYGIYWAQEFGKSA